MKESYWGYWLIMLGVFVVVIMMLISSVTTQNTEDYYLVKEVTEAAMVDAVNYGYYREYGELKIDAEKFVESFLRRFAENVSLNTYEISFYGIYEAPPKVSVRVATKSKSFSVMGDTTTFDIVNRVDAILELSAQEGSSGGGGYTGSANNNSSSGTSSSNNNNTQIEAKSSLYDYIVARAKISSTGYYDCTNATYCEKTTLGNLKYFVCTDYSNYNPAYTYESCTAELETIYNNLPNRINK